MLGIGRKGSEGTWPSLSIPKNIKQTSLKAFERMPDPVVFKKAASRFGLLALARACANCQDEQQKRGL